MKHPNKRPGRPDTDKLIRLGFAVDAMLAYGHLSAQQLVTEFSVTDRTARKDLATLAQFNEKPISRAPGSLAWHNASTWYSDTARTQDITAKRDVAAMAAAEIPSSTSLALSPGSTVALTFDALLADGAYCNAVTNSLSIPPNAGSSPVYIVGGEYSRHIHGLVGPDAAAAFAQRPSRVSLVGVSGLAASSHPDDCTLYVHHDAEVPVLRAMLEQAQEKIIIAVNIQKLGRGDPWQLGTIAGLHQLNHGRHREIVVVTNELTDWEKSIDPRYLTAARQTFAALKTLQQNGQIRLVLAPLGAADSKP